MNFSLQAADSALAPKLAALQHRPRPLPAFLHMLRSETAGDVKAMGEALAGLRRYQEADRQPLPQAMPVALAGAGTCLGATLRDYGGDGPPIVFIPSLINPPTILDLAPGNSLLRWLAAQGHHPIMLDWGWPDTERHGLSVAGHIESILLPLLDRLGEPAVLAGYCLGGTMAVAAAAARPVAGVALIAAPWHFSGFPDDARAALTGLWTNARQAAESLGVLPMEALQTAFWNLDPGRTIGKFRAFAQVPQDSAEAASFVTLEDWANDGPPLPRAAAAELFEDMFQSDLTGRGQWRVAGRIVDPAALPCPILNIVSKNDRIVPAASAAAAGERLDLGKGHVGMIIGRGAAEVLWKPLSDWLFRIRPSC